MDNELLALIYSAMEKEGITQIEMKNCIIRVHYGDTFNDGVDQYTDYDAEGVVVE
jgi:hypothetical protein